MPFIVAELGADTDPFTPMRPRRCRSNLKNIAIRPQTAEAGLGSI
jgi:hypothetical protein